jgi:DNA-3-methyladenine glycosylase II
MTLKSREKVHIHEVMQLPAEFRSKDFLNFHGRDKLQVSERVTPNSLQKALILKNGPSLLSLEFSKDQVSYSLQFDDSRDGIDISELIKLIRHMLGFNQAIEKFELVYTNHPFIGFIVAAQAGLRVPVSVSPFEALAWAIIGQQVSLSAAVSMRRKFIQLANLPHVSGLYCHPLAVHVAQMNVGNLRDAGISQSKAMTLISVSESIENGYLPLDKWLHQEASHEEISYALSRIKGIGPWTINYTLLRGYSWLDGSLHGDAAVRRAIRGLMSLAELTEKEAEQWLKMYAPWRALLAAHLWAWQASNHHTSAG